MFSVLCFRFKKIMWFNVGWGTEVDPQTGKSVMTFHPNHAWVRTGHDPSQPWQKVLIQQKKESSSVPPTLHTSPLGLKPTKVQDLKKMAKKHLPEQQRSFYITIKEGKPKEKKKGAGKKKTAK